MIYSQPCGDAIRVRVPAVLDAQLREAAQRSGAPVSQVIRQAIDLYLAHPAMKASNPQTSDKVTT